MKEYLKNQGVSYIVGVPEENDKVKDFWRRQGRVSLREYLGEDKAYLEQNLKSHFYWVECLK